ncbi:MAG: class II fructose-bisphosphate aldolase, partial [Clostridia bacterium]|nr:class II fructose-bisphosphate aldolase [Clostridia bacterium]
PAIGTAHGLYKGVPNVEFDLLRTITDRVECPTVVHGGTGLSDEAFRRCIENGAAKINISTALKVAWCQNQLHYLQDHADENDPLKSDAVAMNAVADIAIRHMRLFGCKGKS